MSALKDKTEFEQQQYAILAFTQEAHYTLPGLQLITKSEMALIFSHYDLHVTETQKIILLSVITTSECQEPTEDINPQEPKGMKENETESVQVELKNTSEIEYGMKMENIHDHIELLQKELATSEEKNERLKMQFDRNSENVESLKEELADSKRSILNLVETIEMYKKMAKGAMVEVENSRFENTKFLVSREQQDLTTSMLSMKSTQENIVKDIETMKMEHVDFSKKCQLKECETHAKLEEVLSVVTAIRWSMTEAKPIASPCGRYVRSDKEIGRGSIKTVWVGNDRKNGSKVAWCEILTKNLKDKKQDVEKEIALLKECENHPNVLNFHTSFKLHTDDSGKPETIVLITELLKEGTLNDYIGSKCIELHVIRMFGRQILSGLHFFHTKNIIHRDLKCDNIFTDGKIVKIGDLGTATVRRSYLNTEIGTPAFMAPEMIQENPHYDHRVDVYAFGMCLLEMYTGECPYKEWERSCAIIHKKIETKAFPDSLQKVTDPVLKKLVTGCIQFDRSQRLTLLQLLDHKFFAEVDDANDSK